MVNWKKILGRGLTLVVAAALFVFAITGNTPTWWEGAIGLAATIATVVIGEWKPPA